MSRRAALDLLRRLAFVHLLVGDARKGGAYNGAIWPLSRFEGDFEEALASGELGRIRGVGRSTLEVLRMAFAGEEPPGLLALEAQIPEGVFALAKVRGLGAKGVARIWNELGVASLAELEYACNENRLASLKGFGDKKQATILGAVRRLRAAEGWFRRDQALDAAAAVALDATVVGAVRRGHEVVRRLELLARATPDEAAAAIDGQADEHGAVGEVEGVPVRVWSASEGWGTAMVRRTGSEAHLAALGPLPDAETEADVYAELGLRMPAAERREDQALVPVGAPAPRLVRMSDLRGALHNHTTASDGRDSLADMAAAAAALGLTYLGISEHSQTASYARGLTPERLRSHADAIRGTQTPCALLAGIESDILADGALDYDDELLEALDFVVASVHQRHRQDADAMTARMVRAASHRCVDVVGHPTGRLLLGRPPAPVDVAALLDAAAASGCAVELNCSPQRLDLSAEHLAMAKERGVLVSIAADAHSAAALSHLEHGIVLARRAGLGPEDVLNTRSLPELRGWLAARRARHA